MIIPTEYLKVDGSGPFGGWGEMLIGSETSESIVHFIGE